MDVISSSLLARSTANTIGVLIRSSSEVRQKKDNYLYSYKVSLEKYLAQKEIEMSNARTFSENWLAPSITSFLFQSYENSIFPGIFARDFDGKRAKKRSPFLVFVSQINDNLQIECITNSFRNSRELEHTRINKILGNAAPRNVCSRCAHPNL